MSKSMRILLVIIALILILVMVGCGSETRTEEHGQIIGEFNGQPISIAWTRSATGATTITMPPINTGGMLSSGNPWIIGAGILSALLGGGGLATARSASKQVEYHKNDAQELYDDLKKAKGLA